jgi:hypothetical protein
MAHCSAIIVHNVVPLLEITFFKTLVMICPFAVDENVELTIEQLYYL